MKDLLSQAARYLPISLVLLLAPVMVPQAANTVITAGYDLPAVTKVGWLVVSENGVPGAAFEVSPFLDNIHVLAVTHADGTPVTLNSPAKAGEALVMWLAGLGQTSPLVPSGQATPAPAPTVAPAFQLYLEYRPNAGLSPVLPGFSGMSCGTAAVFWLNSRICRPVPSKLCSSGAATGNTTVQRWNTSQHREPFKRILEFDGVDLSCLAGRSRNLC